MFEQQLFESENAVQPELEADGLFGQYEIKTWELSPRLFKIVAASAIANVLALLVFAQTSVLTMKGCDSPLVGSVCQALDTVYVGAMLFGTDREYVDAEYAKTDLGDAEITYIDVTGVTPPLSYPEGYFQIANPVQWEMAQQQQAMFNEPGMLAPGIPAGFPPSTPMQRPQMGGSLLDTKPNPPKPKSNVIDGDLPDSVDDAVVAGTNPGTTKRPPGGKKPAANVPERNEDGSIPGIPNSVGKNPDGTVNPTTTGTNENGDPLINKRPFVDLANNVNDLLDKNQVKLESAFVVNASGKLTKDGKFDPKSFRYGQAQSNDEKLIDIVKESIEAINDSGYLAYLKDLSGKDFGLLLQQDDLNITAIVQSELESDTRARSIKSSLDLAISLAKMKKTSAEADQNDKDDLVLLEGAKIEVEGKRVIIRFVVPKQVALPMIQRKLAEQKAAPKQPNGNAIVRTGETTAKK
ncbi:MAG: hypothetical protein KA746_09005 [Pyrinomonadaceae bacterium]|nr:hypothetical protein [Pyrinomonadaceae bacterium]